MGYRINQTLSFTLALALVDRYIEGIEHYFPVKKAIIEYLNDHLGTPAEIRMNCLDNPAAKNVDDL